MFYRLCYVDQKRRLLGSMIFLACLLFVASPGRAQTVDPEPATTAADDPDPNAPSDPIPNPTPDPDPNPLPPAPPQNPLPIGKVGTTELSVGGGAFRVAMATFLPPLETEPRLLIQIKQGMQVGGQTNFDTNILQPTQSLKIIPIADNIVFVTGNVELTKNDSSGSPIKKLLSGVLYLAGTNQLSFRGVGFQNSIKTFQRIPSTTDPTPELSMTPAPVETDPCAEDPDDLSLNVTGP